MILRLNNALEAIDQVKHLLLSNLRVLFLKPYGLHRWVRCRRW